MKLVSAISDMIDGTIGVLRKPPPAGHAPSGPIIEATIQSGFAFVATPIDRDDHQPVDVLEAIKDAAAKCGVTAETRR